jgi:hypothetical protein
MAERQKINHRLPAEVYDAVTKLEASLPASEWKDLRKTYAVLLRDAGWTLQSVADLFGWSRERVRQVSSARTTATAMALAEKYALDIPTPPLKPEPTPRQYVEPSPETLARLLELKPMAMAVRSHSPAFRAEAEEYTRLLNHAHAVEGVTLYRLAKRVGVTHGAIRFRLARYGYKLPKNASSKVYKPILDKNRVR